MTVSDSLFVVLFGSFTLIAMLADRARVAGTVAIGSVVSNSRKTLKQ